MNLTKTSGEWSDELLAAAAALCPNPSCGKSGTAGGKCSCGLNLGVPPNMHPEVLKLPIKTAPALVAPAPAAPADSGVAQ